MTHFVKWTALAVALAAAACKPQHVTISTSSAFDASDAAVAGQCQQACDIMADAGCHVGKDPGCASHLEDDQEQGVGSQIDLGCILEAGPNRAALARCHVTCQ